MYLNLGMATNREVNDFIKINVFGGGSEYFRKICIKLSFVTFKTI